MKTKSIILFALVSIMLLVACSPKPAQPTAEPTASTISVTDVFGRTLTFDEPPQRIVLAGKSISIIADALYLFPEAATRLVGIGETNQSGKLFLPMVDAAFAEKAYLPQDASTDDILALTPDLVILKNTQREKTGMPLETLNIPVLYLEFETLESYGRDLLILGEVFGNPQRAKMLTAYYNEAVDGITRQTGSLPDANKPRTLVLSYAVKDGVTAFNVPPLSWMQTYLVEAAGGRVAWQDANPMDGWMKVSLEQIAAWDADVIFVVAYTTSVDEVLAQLGEDAAWQEFKAMKNGQVYGFAKDFVSWDQSNPRWVLGLQWMASKLHPDLFAEFDLTSATQEFFQTLYGIAPEQVDEAILPIMEGSLN